MSADRQWWPLEYADEIMPKGRASPSDWICARDGKWFLFSGQTSKATEPGRELVDGEVVAFVYSDDLGEVEVTIRSATEFDVTPPVPEDANSFWVRGDTDSFAETMSDFVRNYAELELPDRPLDVVVSFHSDELPHRLVDGRFVSVAGQVLQ